MTENNNQNLSAMDGNENMKPDAVQTTPQYEVYQDAQGQYQRRANYEDFSSIIANSKDEKIWLFNLLEGNLDEIYGMKDNVGKTIEVANIITKTYDSINEETGEIQNGVLTYLIDPDFDAYVTSSKTVYFTVNRIMRIFGQPNNENWENVKVKIESERGQNGNIIKIKMVE